MFANGSWRLDEHRKINEVAEFGASRKGAVENDHARGLADNEVCGDGVRAVGPRARSEVERMPCGGVSGQQGFDGLTAQPSPVDSIASARRRVSKVPLRVRNVGREEVVAGHDGRLERYGQGGGDC